MLGCYFSWDAQYLWMLECGFSWQAQYSLKLRFADVFFHTKCVSKGGTFKPCEAACARWRFHGRIIAEAWSNRPPTVVDVSCPSCVTPIMLGSSEPHCVLHPKGCSLHWSLSGFSVQCFFSLLWQVHCLVIATSSCFLHFHWHLPCQGVFRFDQWSKPEMVDWQGSFRSVDWPWGWTFMRDVVSCEASGRGSRSGERFCSPLGHSCMQPHSSSSIAGWFEIGSISFATFSSGSSSWADGFPGTSCVSSMGSKPSTLLDLVFGGCAVAQQAVLCASGHIWPVLVGVQGQETYKFPAVEDDAALSTSSLKGALGSLETLLQACDFEGPQLHRRFSDGDCKSLPWAVERCNMWHCDEAGISLRWWAHGGQAVASDFPTSHE